MRTMMRRSLTVHTTWGGKSSLITPAVDNTPHLGWTSQIGLSRRHAAGCVQEIIRVRGAPKKKANGVVRRTVRQRQPKTEDAAGT